MNSQGGIVRGGEETSHANSGVKYIVKSTGQHVELEGDEIALCDNAINSNKWHSFTGTPLEIIKQLADEYGCKRGTLTDIQGGEFVMCKKVVRDNQVISVAGTPADIISQLQVEKGCNAHWSWDLEKQDGETCNTCEHEKTSQEMKKGGEVDKKNAKGDCFYVSAELLHDYKYGRGKYFGEPYLVHAEITGTGKMAGVKFAHGFVEDDVFVYDNSNGNTFMVPKQRYYEMLKIETTNPKKYRRYNVEQLVEKLLKEKKYDAWDLDCEYEHGGEVYKVSVPDYMGVIRLQDGGELVGLAHGMTNEDVAKKHGVPVEVIDEQIKKGITVEREHTKDDSVAEIIARDHVYEFADYYDRLEKMEEEAKKEFTDKQPEEAKQPYTVAKQFELREPKSTLDIELNIQKILGSYKSRSAAAYKVEQYLSELTDAELVKKFLSENAITNRAELKNYCVNHQFKARYGEVKKMRERIEETITRGIDRANRKSQSREATVLELGDGGVIPLDYGVKYFYEPDTMMPMDAGFQNGQLYSTSQNIWEKGGLISKSGTDTLAKIRQLRLHELDGRYSEFTRKKYLNDLNIAEAYLIGSVKPLSIVEQDGYKSCILDTPNEDGWMYHLIFKKGLEHMPVPSGLWMDWWEKDHQKYFGVTEHDYYDMSAAKRAEVENKLQLKLWTKDQFWNLFAEFYMPEEYAKWNWDDGGYRLSIHKENKYWNERMAGEYEKEVKKMAKGGAVADKPTEKEIADRWDKKKEHIMQLAGSLRKLRYNLTADMKSEDEKTRLTALVIAIMDKTGERVGNEESESEGHYGVTGFRKKHVSISGNKVMLDYTGKSGVEQDKSFSDELIAKVLGKAIKDTPDAFVFTTSEGFKIKADRINRYLAEYDISAKDLRGYYANKVIVNKLEKQPAAEEEKDREKQFREAIKYAAEKVGHGAATLKNHYLIPELEKAFITKGDIIDLSDFYKTGGLVKMANGGIIETNEVTGMPNREWARAAAGVLLVAYDTGRCLFLKRGALLTEGGKWALVSGGIEAGETPKEAIMREVMEETGHEEDVCFKLSYINDLKNEDFGFYNFIGIIEKEFEPKLNFENEEHKWVTIEEIPSPLHFGVADFFNNVNLKSEILLALELYEAGVAHRAPLKQNPNEPI